MLRFVKARAEGKTLTQAARKRIIPARIPVNQDTRRSHNCEVAFQNCLKVLIEKYLKPLLEAEETKFFKYGKVRINVEALAIRHASLRTAFELPGSYAPRDPKEAAQYGVRVIRVDTQRPLNEYNQSLALSVIPSEVDQCAHFE
jgi:hypothetical protein